MGQLNSGVYHMDRVGLEGVESTGRELGRGAYGKVCEVTYCGTVFAAKQIIVDEKDPAITGWGLWASLYHHNLVRFIGIQGLPQRNQVMMVMEKMDCSLWQYVQDNSPIQIPLHNLLSVLHDISLGLWYLHSCNPPILHRDISPHHVLININAGSLVAKISSFKMMTLVKPVDDLHDKKDSKKDDSDDLAIVPETSDFMPPEALTHRPSYDLPLDVFSFGGVTLFVASGEWPTPKDHSLVVYKIDTKVEVQRRLQYLDKMIGEAAVLRPLVEECLNDNPNKRPIIANVSSRIKDMKVQYPEIKPGIAQMMDDNSHYIQKQFQCKQQQMLEKKIDIAQKDQEIRQIDQELNGKDQEIQQAIKELQQKALDIQEKDKHIQKNDQEILTVNLHIQQRDKEIQQKDQLLQQQHQTLQLAHKEMQLKLQEKHQEIQLKDTLLEQRIQEVRIIDHQLEQANRKMEEKYFQIQTFQNMQGTCEEMLSQLQQAEQKIELKDRELQQKSEEIVQIDQQICALQEDKQALQQHVDNFQKPSWVLKIDDLKIQSEKLGGGSNGLVSVATYRGCKVAVKQLHKKIESPYYLSVFRREMNIAARCHHPNLIQFIGATDEEILCIVTELMHTSLRGILKQGLLNSNQIIPILLGVAYGLNYLHKTTPDPILHRDVSSANVLLNPLPDNQWHPKLSDFCSTSFMRVSKTVAVGNPIYAAPEAMTPHKHSPAMDVFSFGVLTYEMCTRQLPTKQPSQSTMNNIKWAATEASLIGMIHSCLNLDCRERPTTEDVIHRLSY